MFHCSLAPMLQNLDLLLYFSLALFKNCYLRCFIFYHLEMFTLARFWSFAGFWFFFFVKYLSELRGENITSTGLKILKWILKLLTLHYTDG